MKIRLILLNVGLVFSLFSQEMNIEHFVLIDSERGMSNSWVSSITQGPKGYMWLATQNGINRYDGHRFIWYQRNRKDENSLNSNWVRYLSFAKDDLLVYSGHGTGLGLYDIKNQQFTIPNNLKILERFGANFSYSPQIDSLNQIWIQGDQHILRIPLTNPNRFDSIYIGESERSIITVDSLIWVFSDKGISNYNISSLEKNEEFTFKDAPTAVYYLKDHFWIVTRDAIIKWKDELITVIPTKYWTPKVYEYKGEIIALNGNYIYRLESDQLIPILDRKEVPGSPSFQDLYFTKQGQRWIATSKGVWIENNWRRKILTAHTYQYPISQSARGILVDGSDIYLATNDGLKKYRKGRRKDSWQDQLDFQSVEKFNGSIWSGNNLHRILRINKDESSQTYHLGNSEFQNSTYTIAADSIFGLIASTWEGNYKYDESLDEFIKIDIGQIEYNEPLGVIYSTFDKSGNLWLATNGNGLIKIPKDYIGPGNSEHILHLKSDQGNSISSDVITCILPDSKGNIWIGTDVGINKLNTQGQVLKIYSRAQGLVDEKVMSIEEDHLGRIWFATIGHGLYLYYPENESFINFTKEDGLISNNFFFKSSYKSNDGFLFFGTDEGIQTIDPKSVHLDNNPYNINFTQVSYYSSKLKKNVVRTDGITPELPLVLAHNENDLQISFAAIEFNLGNKIHYEYAWEKSPGRWVKLGNNKDITLSGLAPGRYGLKIRALVPGIQNYTISPVFNFHITKPWYTTLTAYLLYILLAGSITYWIYRLQLQRRLAKQEAESAKEINQVKNQLLNYIAHELKTPLTLIKGSVEFILNRLSSISTYTLNQRLQMVENHTDKLNKLVHDVLLLKENNLASETLNLEPIELMEYTHYIISSFESWAQIRKTKLLWNSLDYPLWIKTDKEKYFHILTNILSNALKYTPEGGLIEITPRLKEDFFSIEVKDNGIGISNSNQIKISTDQSSHGLGLQIIKNLTDQLNGKLELNDNHPRGTVVVLTLPLIRIVDKVSTISNNIEQVVPDIEKSTILIVEDNVDIRHHLDQILDKQFNLIIAANGESGLKQAQDHIPDLIISDVMMPVMDGLVMTEQLKSNHVTSHIPIIILSAKDRVQDRIEGYKLGADQYLGKPFHEKELIQIIDNLLQRRSELAEYFTAKNQLIDIPKIQKDQISEYDQQFLEKLNTYIMDNISDPDLSIETVCKHMFLSRSQLHRKLVGLTSLSITKYINKFKIQQAQKLLASKEDPVHQIAFDVGFSDPTYFSRVFKNYTDKSPSEFRQAQIK